MYQYNVKGSTMSVLCSLNQFISNCKFQKQCDDSYIFLSTGLLKVILLISVHSKCQLKHCKPPIDNNEHISN